MDILRHTMIKAIFFDLDGTLVDTHSANYEAYRGALKEYGVELTYDEFKKSIGYQANTFLRWFAPELSDEDYRKIALRKSELYKDTIKESIANIHLIEHLQYLKKNHTIILVTTAKGQNARAVLGHHGIEDCFDHIVSAEDVKASKPSPECYELALKICNIKPSEALAFEDSQPGVEAAEKAGIPVIAVSDFSTT